MELLLIFLVGCAFKDVWDHVKADYGRSRDARVAEVAKRFPGGAIPDDERARAARHHAIGYVAGEVLKGFPVARTGLHAGWIAHKAARARVEAVRVDAHRGHIAAQESLRDRISRYRDAHGKALDEIAERRRQTAEAEGSQDAAPPLPSDTVPEFGPYAQPQTPPADDPRLTDAQRERDRSGLGNACAACGRQGTEDDPLLIDEDGFRVHYDCTAAQRQYAAAEEAGMSDDAPETATATTESPATEGDTDVTTDTIIPTSAPADLNASSMGGDSVDGDAGSDLASTRQASGALIHLSGNLVSRIEAIIANLSAAHADPLVIAHYEHMLELAEELGGEAGKSDGLLGGVHTDIADAHSAAGGESHVADTHWYAEA